MDLKELKERQKWTLNQKIDHSLGVIDQFISRLNGQVYVGFSGGKDSTVLLDLCRVIKPDIKAVFCNTGNEYPDIVRFVRELKNTEGYNIDIIYPKLKPKEVFEKYGFPLVSKEQSQSIYEVRHTKSWSVINRRLGLEEKYKDKPSVISDKWMFLVRVKFETSHKCCSVLKKEPFHRYEKENNVYPIMGIMASESLLREKMYIRQGGCNSFEGGRIKSLPLSIWLEENIWAYIKKRSLKIADIYYKGAKRTGCMFCGYGCQFKDDNRLKMCYEMYPKMYNMFMNYTNNGITYREAMRKVLAVNGLELPDEKKQLELF
jgi:3'-phosphoadenosine 5'-phosphosulfate sulfotransferase (PAPS reductase)/FAD synthetase